MNNLLEKFIIFFSSITLPFTNIKGNLDNSTALSDLSNQPIETATAATCNSTLGWDYIEGAEGYGIVGEETDLWGTINITPDQGIVKGLFYDGETWVDATSTIRSYESWANMNIKKTYDVASDYAIATYWILDDGSSLYCSNTIGVFYLNSIPYNNPTLTYNATSFPNRASMDIYLTGSHSYIRMVEFGISGIVGENKAVPVSPNTYWEIKLNDVRKELFGIIGIGTFTIDASDIGDWYRMAFNDLEQVKITYLSPNFNAGEGSGSNATFYSDWSGGVIKIYSRDNKGGIMPSAPEPPTYITIPTPTITPTPEPTIIPTPTVEPTPSPINCPTACSAHYKYAQVSYQTWDSCNVSSIPETRQYSVNCSCTQGTVIDETRIPGVSQCVSELKTPEIVHGPTGEISGIPFAITARDISTDNNYPHDIVFTIWQKQENGEYIKMDSSGWKEDAIIYKGQEYMQSFRSFPEGEYQWRVNIKDTQGNHLDENGILKVDFRVRSGLN